MSAISHVPDHLVDEIKAGHCVAFVGAGMVMPAVPSWLDLLQGLVAQLEEGSADHQLVSELLVQSDSRALEAAAQLLNDRLGDQAFQDAVAHALSPSEEQHAEAEQRWEQLLTIPFESVLTTNYDTITTSFVRRQVPYGHVLRRRTRGWWERSAWDPDRRPPVVLLHGGAAGVERRPLVVTQRQYRDLIYGSATYLPFLRALLATRTLLFLGFSFSDGYLNELRAEVLAMFGEEERGAPVAYAVMPDMPEGRREMYRRHEGMEVITYDTAAHGHQPFDDVLSELADATAPERILARAGRGRRVVWMDDAEAWNDPGEDVIAQALGRDGTLDRRHDVESALSRLRGRPPVDLLITRWGHRDDGDPDAVRLLRSIREEGIEVPVLVFASGDHPGESHGRALRLGAAAFLWDWADLFREVGRLLEAVDGDDVTPGPR